MRWLAVLALAVSMLSSASAEGLSLETIVALAKPAVVFVHYRDEHNNHCTGSGFLISPSGYVLTCAHVVTEAPSSSTGRTINDVLSGKKHPKPTTTEKIWVKTSDGKVEEAERMYCDGDTDTALLAIVGTYAFLPITGVAPVQGEEAVLLGFPLGQELGTEMVVTRGIVSALRANGTIFQLDAATNPGNSGGPVLNKNGSVIGIAFAKLSGYEGMNFAISATSVPSLNDMLAKSPTLKLWLVHSIFDDDPGRAEAILLLQPNLGDGPLSDYVGSALDLAACGGAVEVARLLLKLGADVNAELEGLTPLHYAAQYGETAVAELLVRNGADINADFGQGTPLHAAAGSEFAASDGNKAVAELLIAKGANANAAQRDTQSLTPLHIASARGNKAVAEVLIAHGANVNAQCFGLGTPLHCAMGIWDGESVFGHMLYRNLVENSGSGGPPPAAGSGDPHLDAVNRQARMDVAKLLVQKGASLTATEEVHGDTPVHSAAIAEGESEILKWLLDSGANIEARNKEGETPLYLAAACGSYGQAQILISKGANMNAKSKAGLTPLGVATKHGKKKVAELLRKHGAK